MRKIKSTKVQLLVFTALFLLFIVSAITYYVVDFKVFMLTSATDISKAEALASLGSTYVNMAFWSKFSIIALFILTLVDRGIDFVDDMKN